MRIQLATVFKLIPILVVSSLKPPTFQFGIKSPFSAWIKTLPLVFLFSNAHPIPAAQYDYFSTQYDKLNGESASEILNVKYLRDLATPYIEGNVLEVGVGTGLQLLHDDFSRITAYTGIDESLEMIKLVNENAFEYISY